MQSTIFDGSDSLPRGERVNSVVNVNVAEKLDILVEVVTLAVGNGVESMENRDRGGLHAKPSEERADGSYSRSEIHQGDIKSIQYCSKRVIYIVTKNLWSGHPRCAT